MCQLRAGIRNATTGWNYHWPVLSRSSAYTVSRKKKQFRCCINVIAGAADNGEYRPPNTVWASHLFGEYLDPFWPQDGKYCSPRFHVRRRWPFCQPVLSMSIRTFESNSRDPT